MLRTRDQSRQGNTNNIIMQDISCVLKEKQNISQKFIQNIVLKNTFQ